MDRYAVVARAYDLVSAEPVYRAGRVAAVDGLDLRPGDRVLDLGCGTGLNLPLLSGRVGPAGAVVGVDRSAAMLGRARARVRRHRWDTVTLVQADATALPGALRERGLGGPYDAVLATYVLSLVPDWPAAWHGAVALLRPGGRVAVVDMQPTTGRARALAPLARLACALGGSDVAARPWTRLELETDVVVRRSLRGGHVQVRVGIVPRQPAPDDGGRRAGS